MGTMDRDLLKDYLTRSGMESSSSEALSHILAEMATRSDLAELRSEMKAELTAMRADLTWRMIAVVGFFATVLTILDLVVGS